MNVTQNYWNQYKYCTKHGTYTYNERGVTQWISICTIANKMRLEHDKV